MIALFNQITQTWERLKKFMKNLLQVHRVSFADISKETCGKTNHSQIH